MPIRFGVGLKFSYDYGRLINLWPRPRGEHAGAARERIELLVNPQGGVMNKIFVIAALSCAICWGQHPEDCKPSALNIPEAKYPCIFPDNRAMFRVIAPDAQKVRVSLGGGLELTKGPDGIWFGKTPQPLVVGFHYYNLRI